MIESVVDVVLVGCAVAVAANHLVRAMTRRDRKPACQRDGRALADDGPAVIVKGALAKGMARARRASAARERGCPRCP